MEGTKTSSPWGLILNAFLTFSLLTSRPGEKAGFKNSPYRLTRSQKDECQFLWKAECTGCGRVVSKYRHGFRPLGCGWCQLWHLRWHPGFSMWPVLSSLCSRRECRGALHVRCLVLEGMKAITRVWPAMALPRHLDHHWTFRFPPLFNEEVELHDL